MPDTSGLAFFEARASSSGSIDTWARRWDQTQISCMSQPLRNKKLCQSRSTCSKRVPAALTACPSMSLRKNPTLLTSLSNVNRPLTLYFLNNFANTIISVPLSRHSQDPRLRASDVSAADPLHPLPPSSVSSFTRSCTGY